MVERSVRPRRPLSLEDVPRYLEEQGVLLDDLNVRTQDLVDLTREMRDHMEVRPQGVQLTLEKTVTGAIPVRIRLRDEPEADHRPWFSADITNDEDSDNNLYVVVNNPHKRYRKLRPTETMRVDFHAPELADIYLKCLNSGESAQAIIVGGY